jgi:hypothetical protein
LAENREQPLPLERNQRTADQMTIRRTRKTNIMATYKDPIQCFAPLEIIERLLEIRSELGYAKVLYVDNSVDLAEFLDAYGFDVYAFSSENEKINYGDYRASIVPGGDAVHCSITAH